SFGDVSGTGSSLFFLQHHHLVQVAGPVGIEPQAHGAEVGEEMEKRQIEERPGRIRQSGLKIPQDVGLFAGRFVDQHHLGLQAAKVLDQRTEIGTEEAMAQQNDAASLVEHGNGTVPKLQVVEGLRLDLGNFFQLEHPFQGEAEEAPLAEENVVVEALILAYDPSQFLRFGNALPPQL